MSVSATPAAARAAGAALDQHPLVEGDHARWSRSGRRRRGGSRPAAAGSRTAGRAGPSPARNRLSTGCSRRLASSPSSRWPAIRSPRPVLISAAACDPRARRRGARPRRRSTSRPASARRPGRARRRAWRRRAPPRHRHRSAPASSRRRPPGRWRRGRAGRRRPAADRPSTSRRITGPQKVQRLGPAVGEDDDRGPSSGPKSSACSRVPSAEVTASGRPPSGARQRRVVRVAARADADGAAGAGDAGRRPRRRAATRAGDGRGTAQSDHTASPARDRGA